MGVAAPLSIFVKPRDADEDNDRCEPGRRRMLSTQAATIQSSAARHPAASFSSWPAIRPSSCSIRSRMRVSPARNAGEIIGTTVRPWRRSATPEWTSSAMTIASARPAGADDRLAMAAAAARPGRWAAYPRTVIYASPSSLRMPSSAPTRLQGRSCCVEEDAASSVSQVPALQASAYCRAQSPLFIHRLALGVVDAGAYTPRRVAELSNYPFIPSSFRVGRRFPPGALTATAMTPQLSGSTCSANSA